jgi:hypothetical protein
MGNRILFCAIVLFALAFARANVYAQASRLGSDPVRREGVEGFELRIVADSLLNSYHLSLDSVKVNFNTSDEPVFRHHFRSAVNHSVGTLYFDHIAGYRIISGENGGYMSSYIDASGRIVFNESSRKEISFSISRMIGERINPIEGETKNEVVLKNESFWDSTAKPILVTLGAAAVIALFFLVRG